MSCSVKINSAQDFKTFCESGNQKSLKIFSQLSEHVKKVGIFGNANPSNNNDWLTVLDTTTDEGFFRGTYNAETNSCELVSSMQLELITATAGYTNRMQQYVAGAQIGGAKNTWFWPSGSSTAEQFTFFLSVSFREAEGDWGTESAETMARGIAYALFYPLNIKAYN